MASSVGAATLTTDSTQYEIGSTVGIRGNNFLAGETVRLEIAFSDGRTFSAEVQTVWYVTADGTGTIDPDGVDANLGSEFGSLDGFLTDWTMSSEVKYGDTLLVTGTGETSGYEAVAAVVSPSGSLHQLHNLTPKWHNGNINSSNSCYAEGSSVSYRYFLENMTSGSTHYFTIQSEATKSTWHALDYLTQYDLTEAGAIVTVGGPCSNTASATPDDCATPVSVATFADPRLLASYAVTPPADVVGLINPGFPINGPADLMGYNVTNVSLGLYYYTGSSGGREFNVVVTFDVIADGSIGFFWGGHMAQGHPDGWGLGYGAGSVTGAPYHMRAGQFDGGGAGWSDRSVSGGVICLPPDVTMTCDAGPYCTGSSQTCSVPAGAESYNWTVTGGTITSGAGTESITYTITAATGGAIDVSVEACNSSGGCPGDFCCAEASVQYVADDCCEITITCPADLALECDQSTDPANTGTATYVVTGVCPTPITVSYTDTETAGACAQEKTITRVWKAIDGNSVVRDQCTQTITVTDDTDPVLAGCPADVTVECDAIPAVAAVTATDNCDASPTVAFTETSVAGACAQEYVLTRTWTATDACGNEATCTQTITVQDTQAPTITCPADIAVECSADVPAPDPGSVTATDACDGSPVVTFVSDVSDGLSCPETITRTYKAVDACGNISYCLQTITIDDTTPPIVTCPSDISVQCATDVPAPNTALVTATDNCTASPSIFFVSDVSDGQSCPETITRTYKAVDDCNNITFCTQTITVDDTMPPTITCPADVNVLCGESSLPAFTGTATATDNCSLVGAITITYVDVNGGLTITRTWTATDECGNQATCDQTITYPPDTEPPTITCPNPVTVECPSDVPAPDVSLVTASDNCDATPTITWVSDTPAGSCPTVITRVYKVTDAAGNEALCQQLITVDDTTPPTLVGCPADVSVSCDAVPTPPSVIANDNCAGVTLDYGEVRTDGACSDAYTLTRTWTATDACGNQASCSQTIIVTDDIAPVVTTCPDDISVQCTADIPAPNPALVSATDNCDLNPIITFFSDVSDGQSCPETIVRKYRVVDACGNASYCLQIITVDDTMPPVVTCPGDISVECMADVPVPDIGLVTATDNCDASPLVEFVSDVTSGAGCPMTVTRTYRATDQCGNVELCTQVITVNDETPPVVTCPADAVVDCLNDLPPVDVGAVTATDNCDLSPTIEWVSDDQAGGCPIVITRTYQATDDCGNVGFCTQTITIDDLTVPQLVGCPADVTVECDAIPAAANVTATDNCGSVTVTFIEASVPGVCSNEEYLLRTWTATDACGNTAECTQTVTVQDNTAPVVTCPDDVAVGCVADVPAPDVNAVTATDTCDDAPVISFVGDVQVGTGCPMTIERTYRAVDVCGNEGFCVQIITVNDEEGPQLVGCPTDVTAPCGDIPPVAVVTATDNCSTPTVDFDELITPGSCEFQYTITRTWTATDDCGNVSQCQQIITVDDLTKPEITCPAGATLECLAEVPAPDVSLVTVTDNCDPDPVVEWVSDDLQGSSCPMELHRTYRVTDACGNSEECHQVFILDDQTPPTFTTLPGAQSFVQCEPTEICLDIAASDNCGGLVTLSVVGGPGAIVGGQWCYTPTSSASFDVTINAEDTCGNFIEDMFHVDIDLNSAPVITNCPENATIGWGETFTADIVATDVDVDQTLTYTFCGDAPDGATLDPNTGHFEWPTTYADICDPTICIEVTDDCGISTTCEFDVCVTNQPPVISCGGDQTICNGYPFETEVSSTDPDNGPFAFYYLVSGPEGLTVDANSGVVSWLEPMPGAWEVCVTVTDSAAVCDPCSPTNADICCFTVNVVALDIVIEKIHGQIQGQYTDVSVDFLRQGSNWPVAGFDFLIEYDASALYFQMATPGEFLDDCQWEYFTYRYGASGNCGAGACPTGVLRIVALAETTGGNIANHPDCFTNDGVADPGPGSSIATQLAKLSFLVSNDRTLECQFAPIRFSWYDCGDNSISNVSGDTLYISNMVFDYAGELGDPPVVDWNEITGLDNTMPTVTGAPSPECDISDKLALIRCANFYNGGVDIICADSIDAAGDINLNGIAYEIADAVMLTNYFITGLGAFGTHIDGSVAASDSNRDGVTLSVADLVHIIRVVIGDALPYAKLTPSVIQSSYSVIDGVVAVGSGIDISGAALVVRGDVRPGLTVDGMDMSYAYDGTNTRIVVASSMNSATLNSFQGSFLEGITGEIISIELSSSAGELVAAKNIPVSYHLEQNFPNPFNPVTTIEFAMPVPGNYSLEIYNIQGQLVSVIDGRADAAGYIKVEWDGSSHASGVYLYRLTTSEFGQTKKMLLLK